MRLLAYSCLIALAAFSAQAAPVAASVPALTGGDADMYKFSQEVTDVDPLEGFNRAMFSVNRVIDRGLLRPVVQGYQFIVPEAGRRSVDNFVDNLYQPVVFLNSVLQADPQNSFATLWRFLLNTSFGVLGLFDFAGEVGLENRSADFGQTLGSWGMGSGSYLYLPIIGPSSARDLAGRGVDMLTDPFNYIDNGVTMVKTGITIVDKRSENSKLIDDIYDNSLDPYATFRSGYLQKRRADVQLAIDGRNQARAKTQ